MAPLFALFFPIDVAIAMTGVVHFTNNIFKIVLIGRNVDRSVLFRFGFPAFIASFAGAWLLLRLTFLPDILQYPMGGELYAVTPVKLTIAILLLVFALWEVIPTLQNIRFGKEKFVLGGILSGFFGGLSGMQGAIRSAFLVKSGMSKEAYIATGTAVACMVDISRLSVYATRFTAANLHENLGLLGFAILCAVAGALLGKKLLKKVTFNFIQVIVAVLLGVVAFALGLGWV
jgi:uncharacterized membrane protein YfcA